MTTEFRLKPLALAALTTFTLSAGAAYAATGIQDAIPVAKSLAGTVKDDGWYNLTVRNQTKVVDGNTVTIAANTGYPSVFNSTNAWPQAIASQVNSGGPAAGFNKVSNGNGFGPYPAGDALYAISFSNNFNAKGGTLGVFEANPVANLASVVFQVELGNANGYDFYQPTQAGTTAYGNASALQVGALTNIDYSPKLNLTFADNTSASLISDWAELSAKGENGTISMPSGEEPIFINLYAFQWDLSSYTNISSYNITFDVVEHSQTYAARLTQSDTFNQLVAVSAVPEPEAYAMFLAGLGLIGFVSRRRKQS